MNIHHRTYWQLLGLLSGVCLQSMAANAVSAQPEAPSPLVGAAWLESHLADPGIRIIDLAHRQKNYREGHIPGAVFIDWRREITNPDNPDLYLMPSADQFVALMNRAGVTPDTLIVLTDNMDTRASIRMYLTLKYFGHDRVCILDGGTLAWKSEGGLMTTDEPDVQESSYPSPEVRPECLVALNEVLDAIERRETVILDSRSADQFTGESPGKIFHTGREHPRRGHIETAINVPWMENFREDGTFKSLEELEALYAARGLDDGDTIVTYCNEGLHASIPWFVLHELLGRENTRVYEHSLGEWAHRQEAPMAQGSARDR